MRRDVVGAPASRTEPHADEAQERAAAGHLGRLWAALGRHPYVVLTVAILACYAPNLDGYFLQDAFTVLPQLRAESLEEFAQLVIQSGRRWRFLWWVAAYAEARLLPLTPLPHILLGVGLFVPLAWCVYAIDRRVTESSSAALAATLVFALLPQHHGRVFTMGKSFVFLCFAVTVWCFTHPAYPRRRGLIALGALALVGTLMSYEPNLFVAAPVVAISALLRRQGPGGDWGPFAWRTTPAVLCTLVYAYVRFGVFADFGGQNLSLTGESTSVLAQGGLAAAGEIGARLLSGLVADLGLLYPAHHPFLGRIGWVYAATAALLLATGGDWRRNGPATLWLGACWIAAFVPLVDVLPQPNPESWYFFWPTWPFALLVAAVGAHPVRSRRGAWLWTALVGVVLVASLSEAFCWRDRFARARTIVATFQESVPPFETPAGVYVLDAPSVIADFLTFTSLEDALLFPHARDASTRLRVWPERAQPQHLPEVAPSVVPETHVRRILVRRWDADAQQWRDVTLPDWARPQPADAPLLGEWECPPPLDRHGWEPNLHLVAPSPQAEPCVWRVTGSQPLLFGSPTTGGPVPLAYAEVTMAVRSPSPRSYAEWLFLTAEQTTFAGDRVFRFHVIADGAPHTYAVPLLENPRAILGGPITQLALRPAPVPGALVRIDRVRLIPWTAPPE